MSENKTLTDLPSSLETGMLNAMHLKRFWSKAMAKRNNKLSPNALPDEWKLDNTLLYALGIGLEQTIRYVYNETPSFLAFEQWIIDVNGGSVSQEKIERFNDELQQANTASQSLPEQVLSEEQINFWNENGYIILKGAVPVDDCDKTIELICNHLDIKRHDPATWYHAHALKQGIMVQLFQDPILQKNRDTELIRKAYEQLWNRKDLWVSTDRVGFNPPETERYKFPGPKLHWDVSLELPIPFGLQGILYLSDTAENQGAFTLVPGFQNRIDNWINSLPANADPRTENLYALGHKPIAAGAGDFIIWHHALPHGSSPNTSAIPRFVQYINYEPINPEVKSKWR